MKKNNIETAREFYLHKAQMQPDIEELQMMVLYANYLNSDGEWQKSAEIILQEQKDKFPYNWGRNAEHMAAYVPNEIALKAMHEFAAQSRPELTDDWISVLDKKPKAQTSVIVFDGECVFSAFFDDYYEDEPEWQDHEGNSLDKKITHWQPLPSPPEWAMTKLTGK